jgi:hypothetical protein
VVKDIEASGPRNYIFLDDNIMANPEYARDLFTVLLPLKINWVGQSSISFARDRDDTTGKKSRCKDCLLGWKV